MAKKLTVLKFFLERLLVTFLSLFYIILWNPLRKPRPLSPEDRLSSFIKRKGYDKQIKQITLAAFMPKEYRGRLETSVFRTTGLRDNRVWRLAYVWTVVNPIWKRSGTQAVTGRADLATSAVIGTGQLFATLNPSPHPEHVNILGWDQSSSAQELQALLLVQASTYVGR
jgi:hypothetical protein